MVITNTTCGTFSLPTNSSDRILSVLFGVLYIILMGAMMGGNIYLKMTSSAGSGSGKAFISTIVSVLLAAAYVFKGVFFLVSTSGPSACLSMLILHLIFYAFLFGGMLFLLYKCFESLRIVFIKRRRPVLIRVQQGAFALVGLFLVIGLTTFILAHYDVPGANFANSAFVLLIFFGIMTLILVQAIFLRIRSPERYAKRRSLYVGLILYGVINLLSTVVYLVYYEVVDKPHELHGTLLLSFFLGYIPAVFPALLMVYYTGLIQSKDKESTHEEAASEIVAKEEPSNTAIDQPKALSYDEINAMESKLLSGS